MRSSGSAKSIWVNREEVLLRLKDTAKAAKERFPEILDVRIFGSLAKGEETGLSDVDIIVVAKTEEMNPLERIRPYFNFFSESLGIAIDLLVVEEKDAEKLDERFGYSFSVLGK